MSFKSFLKEESEIPVVVFIGRFQPWHLGHSQVIKDVRLKFPQYKIIIGIVKGNVTSQDKEKNPLPFTIQRELVVKSLQGLDNIVILNEPLPNGYIPEVYETLKAQGYNMKYFVSGQDRREDYIKMTNDLDIELVITKKYMDATNIRDYIRKDDENSFRKSTSKNIWKYYNKLKGLMI